MARKIFPRPAMVSVYIKSIHKTIHLNIKILKFRSLCGQTHTHTHTQNTYARTHTLTHIFCQGKVKF